jgi:hypothetical protein
MERTCPQCQKSFDATAAKCPHCGTESPAWEQKDGRWWVKRYDRWWWRDDAGSWRPYAGAEGIEPESVDTWAILEQMRVQTALLGRIAFWVTLFGVLTVIGTLIWIVGIITLGAQFG